VEFRLAQTMVSILSQTTAKKFVFYCMNFKDMLIRTEQKIHFKQIISYN